MQQIKRVLDKDEHSLVGMTEDVVEDDTKVDPLSAPVPLC